MKAIFLLTVLLIGTKATADCEVSRSQVEHHGIQLVELRVDHKESGDWARVTLPPQDLKSKPKQTYPISFYKDDSATAVWNHPVLKIKSNDRSNFTVDYIQIKTDSSLSSISKITYVRKFMGLYTTDKFECNQVTENK